MATESNEGGLLPVRKVDFKVRGLAGEGGISYTPLSNWGETDHAGSKISVSTFELSSKGDDGKANTARVYQMEGVGGVEGLRYLPIAQLVMAICFARAAEKEAEVVKLMNKLANTSQTIEELSHYEELIVAHSEGWTAGEVDGEKNFWPHDWAMLVNSTDPNMRPAGTQARATQGADYTWLAYFNKNYFNPDGTTPNAELSVAEFWKSTWSGADVDKILEAIETKLDSLNTMSQKDMIALQSETTKRDQTYDLVSAMVKSFSTGNTSIASNLR